MRLASLIEIGILNNKLSPSGQKGVCMPVEEHQVQAGRPMTSGEIAVGLAFNPSGDEKVAKLKTLFAEAFDIVEKSVPADDGTLETARKRKMRDAALHEIVTAQMWAVKVITLRS
jgi:hypothetical protein